jgi:hypothetical protein
MSNYLNNLAARALRHQDVVRPRVASLFEPPSRAQLPLPAGPPEVETISYDQIPDAASTIRSTALPAIEPRSHRRQTLDEEAARPTVSPSPRPDALVGEVGREIHELRPVLPATSRARESTVGTPGPFIASGKKDDAPPPRRVRTETPVRVEVVRPENRTADATVVSARTDEAAASAVEKVRDLEGRVASLEAPRVSDRRHPEATTVPATVGRATRQPATEPLTPLIVSPAAASGFERSNEPPHVTVTIGRVDVRALFPAPAQAPSRPTPHPGPVMTLAEYLKQRERRQR